jgi:hypothetical protein
MIEIYWLKCSEEYEPIAEFQLKRVEAYHVTV